MPAPSGTPCRGEPAAPLCKCHPGYRSRLGPPCHGPSARALHFPWQAADSNPCETGVMGGCRAWRG